MTPVFAVEHVNVAPQIRAVVAALRERNVAVELISSPAAGVPISSLVPRAQILLVSTNLPLDRTCLEAMPALRGVVFIASGTNSIDLDVATSRGIAVAHSPVQENAESMAEATVMLMLASLYQLPRSEQLLRDGWKRPAVPFARMLEGKTIGLIGFGGIARGVALRLRPWGADIIYTSRTPKSAAHERWVSLPELIERSDVVSVHVPFTVETRNLIDADTVLRMKRGSVLINTSRGGIVDEAAVAAALNSGHLSAAAIDTFVSEPIDSANPLLAVPGAILTPHIVGHSIEANDALIAAAIGNVVALVRGERPRFLRNPEAWT